MGMLKLFSKCVPYLPTPDQKQLRIEDSEKRFGSNEEVIAETEAYFESKDESSYKKGIEKLENGWNKCITLEGNHVDE